VPRTQEKVEKRCFMPCTKKEQHNYIGTKMFAKSIPAVDFINVLRAHFLYKILVPKNYKAKMQVEKSCTKTFVRKTGA